MRAIHRRAVCEICGEVIQQERCYVLETQESPRGTICEECADWQMGKVDPALSWFLWDALEDHHKDTPDYWEEEEGMP